MYFPKVFIGQVKDLALQIAYHQRGERKLQEVETIDGKIGLKDKYEIECQELRESEHPEEEIPDVVYYACQLYFLGHKVYLSQVEQLLDVYGLDEYQARAITLAKYRIRAEGPNSNDFERERVAIRAALR